MGPGRREESRKETGRPARAGDPGASGVPAPGEAGGLGALDYAGSLQEKLAAIHGELRRRVPAVDRIAVAAYDARTDSVSTLVHSTIGPSPLAHYEVRLSEAPSLREIARARRGRVIDDLRRGEPAREHTRRIRDGGYRSSYTLPILRDGLLYGFLFFDSRRARAFTAAVRDEIDVYAHLVSALTTHELFAGRLLAEALKIATEMVHQRDPETGAHLERMARFARLIARRLAMSEVHPLDDEFVERIFLFAPLHDVGKIGIPDEILLKPGPLTEEEFQVMQSHTVKGAHIVDAIVRGFGLSALPSIALLRNIAESHHESMDGTGYPRRLSGDAIPLEARIVAVADIFDALTSDRPYRKPCTNDEAIGALRDLTPRKLDEDCVEALARERAAIEEIQLHFADPPPGGGAPARVWLA